MVLAVNLKENYLLDLCVVSSNPLRGVPFFLGQNLREGLRSPERETPLRGEHQKVWCALATGESPSPSTGLGRWGKTAPEGPPVEKEREEAIKRKKEKTNLTQTGRKRIPSKELIPFWNAGSTWNNFF